MQFFSRYTFRLSLCAVLIALTFMLICTCLIPPVLKNALLQSKNDFMQESSEFLLANMRNGYSEAVVSSAPEKSAMRLVVANSHLTVVFDSSREDDISGKYLLLPGLNRAIGGEKVYHAYSEDSDFVYSLLCPFDSNGETWFLYIRYTDPETCALFKSCKQVCIFSGILLLSVPVIILILQIISFDRSVTRLSDTLSRLTDDKTSGDEINYNTNELNQVTQSLDAFAREQAKTEELRRRFVSDASHELKTPLAAVKLLSDTILLTPKMSHDDIREFLSDISNETDRLTRICTRLLKITQYDTFSDSAELVPLDLAVVGENVSRMLSGSANAAGLELRCEFQDGCFVLANYDLVFQVFYNIIENALKYGRDGKEVRVFLYNKEGSVIFITDDDGSGIPESDLERIFDRFYRVDKARSRATGGTGLGLSIVASAVATCNGTIEAQNRTPHGARFIVRFPACAAPEGPKEKEGGEEK